MKLGYIISAQTEGKDKEYYAIDHNSGGYPYWAGHPKDAELFKSLEEANKELDSSEFTKEDKMSNGKVYPPIMIQSAAGICYAKTSGNVIIFIEELIIKTVTFKEYFGEIKIPTEDTYK